MPKLSSHSFALAAAALACLTSIPPSMASDVPEPIAARGEILVAAVQATGTQIYECKIDMSGGLAWQFREPIATLFAGGKTVGRHYAGPHWEMTDGSTVGAKVSARAAGASELDIPLLKLEVTSWHGTGQLAGVTTIQRLNTKGGMAEGPCSTAGEILSVPYSADYTFYRREAAIRSVPAPVANRPAVVRHVPVATPVLVSPPAVGVIVVRRDARDWPRKKKKTGGQPKSPPTQPTPPSAEPTTPPSPTPPTAEPTTPPATPNKVVRDHRGSSGSTVTDTRYPYDIGKDGSRKGPSKQRLPEIRDHRAAVPSQRKPEVRDHRGASTPPKTSAAGGAKGAPCMPGNPSCKAN